MLVKTESVDMITGEQSSDGWSRELVRRERFTSSGNTIVMC